MGFFPTFLYSQLFVTPKYPDHDFTGQTIIVTGSNVGLGFEAVRHLVRLNAARVIIACRTISKGEKAKEEILSSTKRKDDCIEVWKLDLSDYDSVKAFAERAEGLDRLDAVIENAGVSNSDWSFDEKGEETTIKTNVISTFLLALLLLPKLREAGKKYETKTRLEIVTSEMHHFAKIDAAREENLYSSLAEQAKQKSGSNLELYPLSKLLEILFVRELVKHTSDHPIITLVNPGWCFSNLAKPPNWVVGMILKSIMTLLARTTEVGSRNLIAGIVADAHGKYMHDGMVREDALADWIRTAEGERKQREVWQQTMNLLERIEPGIEKNL